MKIISRAQWGAQAWRGTPHSVPMSARTHFLVHYHGGPPPSSVGSWVPKNIEAIHLGNGWSGVGYNFVVDQAGNVYEGRGWSYVGAHCPGKNRTGIGVQVAIGGNQAPTEAAKRAVVALYREANRRAGRTLTRGVHGDYYATACAGPKLTPWVHSGMSAGGAIPDITTGSDWTPSGGLSTKDIQELVGVTQDGDYGPATTAAVKELQQALDLTADGLWGPTTEGAVMSLIDEIKKVQTDNKRIMTQNREILAALDSMPSRVVNERVNLSAWTREEMSTSLEQASLGGLLGYAAAGGFPKGQS